MRRAVLLISTVLISLAPIADLQAQKVGTYSGTSADGGFISLKVEQPGGVFTFTAGDVNFMPHCTHPSRIASEGWGFSLDIPIVSGTNDFHSGNDYYDTRGSLHFVNNKVIKGTITSVTAVFVPGADPPNAAQFCKSAKQAFTLNLQPVPTTPAVLPGTAVAHH